MSVSFHLVLIMGFCSQMTMADCPRLCECKWKYGKESVICLNANLSTVPTHLEAGTQVLDLTGNNLSIIKHDEFSKAGLLNLQKVYISKCRLKSLERYAFRYLINLVELDLSYNALISVPSHTFDSISELRELKLNGNPIQRIVNDAFINVPQLIRLELSDCRIETIEIRAFFGLEKSLEWLKLDKNKLMQVNSESFTILQNLHGLELAGNPWNCSCALRPLREWMLRQNVPFGIPPLCHHPKRLHLKPWDKLDLDEFACIPEIFAYENKAHGVEGKNVTITCRIAGIPEPSVRWLLKNKVIANLSGSSSTNGKKLYMVHLQNHSSDLTIFSADLQDAGVYICAAENKAGRAEASVTLAVIKKPPESSFSNKILIASIVTGVALVLASCLIAICVYTVRKKQMLRWRNNRECHREDNYEKIEMNHHKVLVANNGSGSSLPAEIAVVAAPRKNGEYRVVPDQEDGEDEGEDNDGNKKNWENTIEKRWNSPEHLLDPEDLHIPRRTLQEARDDIKKTINSMSGTSNYYQASTSQTAAIRKQIGYATAPTAPYNCELSSLVEDDREKRYPDLIENSSYKYNMVGKANSEGGSINDITELFCTLPRKRALIQSTKYRSTDSQSPLLPSSDSRYGSSGGDSYGSQEYNLKSYSNRVTKLSNSYLNLARDELKSSTPLLDVSNLENKMLKDGTLTPNANSTTTNYNYHAAQLEKFLEEYRILQKQLSKMKESCDHLKIEPLTAIAITTTNNPNGIGGSAGTTTTIINTTTTSGSPSSTTTLTDKLNSPNSNQSFKESIDFRNFESELTKYLLAKSSSPKTFNNGVYNN